MIFAIGLWIWDLTPIPSPTDERCLLGIQMYPDARGQVCGMRNITNVSFRFCS